MESQAIDFECMSTDEIKSITEVLLTQSVKLKAQQEENEKAINSAREVIRDLIPDVTEIMAIANRRQEQLDRRRRFEKKMLSIFNRFPSILNADQPQIISTDISILNTQLELIGKRAKEAQIVIEEFSKKRDRLEQLIVDLSRQSRLQKELMTQRDHDKEILISNLQQELDSSKTLYVSDSRAIERKKTVAENLTSEHLNQLNALKTQYDVLVKQRASILNKVPLQNAEVSSQIASKLNEMILKLEEFSTWWTSRRTERHYTDRLEFLLNVNQKTKERFDKSYQSIEFLRLSNISRNEEIRSIQNMNVQLSNSIEEKKNIRKSLDEKKADLLKSFKPLPKEIDIQLKQLRERRIALQNREKSLEIELQVLGVSEGPSRAESRFDDARRHHRTLVQEAARLRESICELKRIQSPENLSQRKHEAFVSPLTALQDSSLLVSEEAPYVVQAAPLELLEKLVFNPATDDDSDFFKGLLVFVHSEKVDMSQFTQSLMLCYNNTEFCEKRDDRLKELVETWRMWFQNDFQDSQMRSYISPLINVVGITGMYDAVTPNTMAAIPSHLTSLATNTSIRLNIVFDQNVPFDSTETKLAFCAPPLVIAEHFTYIEANILRTIQASEFIGCGWTTSDKWTRSPHIMKMIDHFNFVSQWIVFSIVSIEDVGERASLLEKWITIMDAASEIVNFQLVFEVYAALCSPAITHLASTWAQVDPEIAATHKKYTTLGSPSGRFSNYRKELEKYPKETVIPYIGPFLTSLVYISDGNPSKKTLPTSPDPVVNFQKFRSYASVLDEIIAPWGRDMCFYLHEDLLKRIQNIPPVELSESELFQRSLKLKK